MEESTSYQNRPNRAGRKGVMTYLDAEDAKQLRMIALDRDKTVQGLLEDLITDFLKKNRLSVTKKRTA